MFMHNYCVHQERLKSNMATITAVKVFTFCALLAITKGTCYAFVDSMITCNIILNC